MRHRLGEYLVESGLISRAQLEETLHRQAETHQAFGRILQDSGWLTSRALAEALAEQLVLEFVDADTAQPDLAALRHLPQAAAASLLALPVRRESEVLVVAVADPLDIAALEELELRAGLAIQPAVAAEDALPGAIERAYTALEARRRTLDDARRALRHLADSTVVREQMPRLIGWAGSAEGSGVTRLVAEVAALAGAVGHRTLVLEAPWTPASDEIDLLTRLLPDEDLLRGPELEGTVHHVLTSSRLRLDSADELEVVTLATNLVRFGRHYDPIFLDLGSPPSGITGSLLAAADVSLLLTTPQDLVRGYDVIRALAREREALARTVAGIGPWALGIVVTLVESPEAGRHVFDQLQEAVREHVNPESSARRYVELGYLGVVPWRDIPVPGTSLTTQKGAGGAASSPPDEIVRVAKAVMDRATRVRPDPWPMAGLVKLACGDA